MCPAGIGVSCGVSVCVGCGLCAGLHCLRLVCVCVCLCFWSLSGPGVACNSFHARPRHFCLFTLEMLLLVATIGLLLGSASALRTPGFSRRKVASAAGAACFTPQCVLAYAKLNDLSMEDRDAIEKSSRTQQGRSLPSGVRIIDLLTVDPRRRIPAKGDRVYVHFKVWTNGFRTGTPVDSSFVDKRPYDYVVGQPDERFLPGFDEGLQGMGEGDWRRLVVPAALAYGQAGLPKGTRGAYLVKPDQDVYVDLLMFDFDKCDPILRPPGAKIGIVEFAHLGGQRSLICERGKP